MKNKKRVVSIITALLILSIVTPIAVNQHIIHTTKGSIYKDLNSINHSDVGLLLGALVYKNNKVSQIVYDRIIKTVELYNLGKIDKIIVSGDHGRKDYDEVNTIKSWLLKHSVDEDDIFMDHAGFSTYESLYRAKEIFGVTSVTVITQKFHLPRPYL